MSESEEKDTPITLTLTIPGRLAPLLRAAAREIDVTHGSGTPGDQALLLHLIERGARHCVDYSASADYRSVGSISVAELADVLGIGDLEASRRQCREARELHEQAVTKVKELFAHCDGLRQINAPRQIRSVAEIHKLASEVSEVFKRSPNISLVIAIAYHDAGAAVKYAPVSLN